MYLLPSLFTSVNIGAGYWSITQTIAAISGNAQMHLDLAAIGILLRFRSMLWMGALRG